MRRIDYFPIQIRRESGVRRGEFQQWMEGRGVDTRMVWSGNILRQPGYMGIKRRVYGKLDQSDRIMNDTFFIGVYSGISEDMLSFVLDRFKVFFESRVHAV